MKALRPALAIIALSTALTAHAQVVLTGTSYTQDFNAIGSGLPAGWSVSTSATLSALGDAAIFTQAATVWSSTTGVFRNIASNTGTTSDNTATQNANTDRALGWRPVGVTSENTGPRQGAVTFALANTSGLQNFNLSVSIFTANDVANNQTYALEYRVGTTGNFTSLGTYTTGTPFNPTTLTANSVTLSALNNQSEYVFIRIRGTSLTGTGNLDTLGIDNFSLTYTAVPEPSTYAFLAGVAVLAFVVARRRYRPCAVA
ncbi:MAG TPA: PEP-CTERM sorting domain-containing protein [Opitutaceae bacterium]|mgnify:CR=1 FL=1|nr:PEP-CTERM sorting domain-containing protein [Opitutaceae bacterium]